MILEDSKTQTQNPRNNISRLVLSDIQILESHPNMSIRDTAYGTYIILLYIIRNTVYGSMAPRFYNNKQLVLHISSSD